MTVTLKDVRAKYPQYSDLSDQQLADAIHKKFYADMPQADFYGKIGLNTAAPSDKPEATSGFSPDVTQEMASISPKLVGSTAAQIASAMAPDAPIAPQPSIGGLGAGPAPDAPPASSLATMGSQRLESYPPSRRPAAYDTTTLMDQAIRAAVLNGDQVAPVSRGPDRRQKDDVYDPFAGEGAASLTKRRGQQVAQGATEVVASVPEAMALFGRDVVRSRYASASAAVDQLTTERNELSSIIQNTPADSQQSIAAALRLQNVDGEIIRAARMVSEDMQTVATPVNETPLFKSGDTIRKASKGQFGAPDPRDQGFWAKAAQGAGSVAGFAVAATAGTLAGGPVGGLVVGGGAGATSYADQLYQEAIASGATEETALKAARLGGLVGLSEILPISRALKILPRGLRNKVGDVFHKTFLHILESSGEEAAQEFGQQVAGNLVAANLYDPDRGWADGATENAIIGAMLGGGLATVGAVANPEHGDSATLPSPSRVKDDVANPSAPPPDPIAATMATNTPAPPAQSPKDAAVVDLAAFGAATKGAAIPSGSPAARQFDALVSKAKAAGLTDDEIDTALAGNPTDPLTSAMTPDPVVAPVQPAPPPAPTKADAAPATPEKPKQADSNFEIMPEIDVVDGQTVETGRMVRVNLDTDEATLIEDQNTSDGPPAVAGNPGAAGTAGDQPQAAKAAPEALPPPAAEQNIDPKNRPGPVRKFLTHDETVAIQTDPKAFQYKGNADHEGVTDALKGVTQFDPNRAGQVVLFQRNDGTMVVADGHQRTGLARRMASGGQADVGGTAATIYREADGYTPGEVMNFAALKNIGEGSGTATDAARILRSQSGTIAEMGLPPNSALVRKADGLRRLGDQAFGMVVNGVASEEHGDVVGRNVPDKAMQSDILALLTRAKPENLAQAAMIARDAASNATTETQDSLFGPEDVKKNLYVERAKVLDHAMKSLGSKARTFRTLIDQADSITQVGNQLSGAANAQQLDDATRIRQYLDAQANMKGPISDALTEAARQVAAAVPVATAARGFVQNVARGMAVGGSGGQAASPGGRGNAPVKEAQRPDAVKPAPPADPLTAAMLPEQSAPKAEPVKPPPGDDLLSAMLPVEPAPQAKPKPETAAQPKPQQASGRPQSDLFDQSGARGPGGRQMDIEDLIDEKKADATKETPDSLISHARAFEKSHMWPGQSRSDNFRDLMADSSARRMLAAMVGRSAEERHRIADSWVLAQGKVSGTEYLVIFDRDGNPVVVGRGTKSAVGFDDWVVAAGAAGELTYITHNHPRNSGLSPQDIDMMFLLGIDVVAMGNEGHRHSARLLASNAPKFGTQSNERKALREGLNRANGAIHKYLQDKLSRMKGSHEEIQHTIALYSLAEPALLSLALHRMGVIEYSGDAQQAIDAAEVSLDDIFESAKAGSSPWFRRAGLSIAEGGDRGATGQDASGATDAPDKVGNRPTEPDAGNSDGRGRVPEKDLTPEPDDFGAALDDVFGKSEPATPSAFVPFVDSKPGDQIRDGMYVAARKVRIKAVAQAMANDLGGSLSLDGTNSDSWAVLTGEITADAASAALARAKAAHDEARSAANTQVGTDPTSYDFKQVLNNRWARKFDAHDGGGVLVNVTEHAGGYSITVTNHKKTNTIPSVKVGTESQLPAAMGVLQAYLTKLGVSEPVVRGKEPRSSADIAKDLGGLFSETTPSFAEGGLDQAKYDKAVPLFTEALSGHDVAVMSRKDTFVAMIRPLVAAGLNREAVAKMQPYFERFLDDVGSGKIDLAQGKANAPSANSNLERDSGNPKPEDGLGTADVPAARGGNGTSPGDGRGTADGGVRQPSGERLPDSDAASVGTGRDQALQGNGRPAGQSSDGGDGAASGDRGQQGLSPDEAPASDTQQYARGRTSVKDRTSAQAEGDAIAKRSGVLPANEQNVRDTLPLLMPEQQDDVIKVERRFAKTDSHGMLLTNGTGTGKTYSGGGVIKRFAQSGRTNILILAPSQGILDHWIEAGADLGLNITKLGDASTAGRGVVATTYANAGMNNALAGRQWDLVVTDESHKLSQNASGDGTGALRTVRAITNRPADLAAKSQMLHADEWEKARAMKDGEAKTAAMHRLFEQQKADVARFEKEPRSKVLMLSATPFAYDSNVDYAEGYLFDYPPDGHVGYSRQSGRNLFMVENFGYRIRNHKLTKPDANVDGGVFERQFHEKLKREGVLSGRSLDIVPDYERRFVQRDDAQGSQIDDILQHIQEKTRSDNKEEADDYRALSQSIRKSFNYLKRMQLLEAIKAKSAQADIEKHLALGRKIVIFHDYNVGGGFNPFDPHSAVSEDDPSSVPLAGAAEGYARLLADKPEVATLNFESYLAPITELKGAYGDRAVIYNGTISQKDRAKAKKDFNADGSGVDIMIVQSAAGEAGISLHDITGNHQRALINLGMPTRPTTALQEEGRIRREGSVTDALFHYYTIGTTWERQAFAKKIAERSGTVENLALGNEARTIRDSFIQSYEDASAYDPSAADGKGGKEADRSRAMATPYDQAKAHYFGRMKTSGKRTERDGIDFYPTPEPVAFKMVEWAGIRPYERTLEPSAGDGSIARYFPDHSDRTIVEPSTDLITRAELRTPGARAVNSTFEQYHIVNKHHVIVMNPPFGSGGKTAFDHLAKAMIHLKDGGRIVALVPMGSTANSRLEKLLHSDDAKDFSLTADIELPAVTFEKAGTSIASRVLVFDRVNDAEARHGMPATKHINMTGSESIKGLFDRLEGISVPDRPVPSINAADEMIDEQEAATSEAALVAVGRSATLPAAPLPDQAFKTGETVHAKTGENLFVATATARVSSDAYQATLAVAKRHDGWYSSFRGNGAIPGYQFKSEQARQDFLDDMKKPTVGFEETSPDYTAPDDGPLSREVVRKYMPQLRAELDRLDLKRVGLYLDNTGAPWQGMFLNYGGGHMEIMIAASMNPMKTLHHEVIHVLRAMKLFTDQEWQALTLKAEKSWMQEYDIVKRYPRLTHPERIEEAIAEAFADAVATKTAPRGSLLVNAFNKIARLMRAIRNVFQGAGFQTAEDVFGRAYDGQLTKRGMNQPTWDGDLALAQKQQAARTDGRPQIPLDAGVDPNEVLRTVQLSRTIPKDEQKATARSAVTAMRGQSFITQDGTKVEITRDTAGKIGAFPKGDWSIRAEIAASLDRVIQAARVFGSRGDDADRRGMTWKYAAAVVEIDGEPVAVKMALERIEREDRTIAYEVNGYDIKRLDASIAGERATDAPVLQPSSSRAFTVGEIADSINNGVQKFQAARIPSRQARANMATAMNGSAYIPDRWIWEELTRANAPILSRIGQGLGAVNDAIDKARVLIQDRFLPMLRAQQALERHIGAPLSDDQNVYTKEETFSGKVGKHLIEVEADYIKPIIKMIADTKGGLTVEGVDQWLYARHAIERNARIAAINPAMSDGGSGMTNAEAQAILGAGASGPHAQTLAEIGALVDSLRERTLKLREDKGLITHDEANTWRKQYKHYVPLKGFADTENSDAVLDLTGTGRRYNTRGQETKRALGRQSTAFSPLMAAIVQAQEVSIRAERNAVGASMYELAKAFPSPALWSVKKVKMKRFFNRATGLVESRPEDPVSLFMEPNEMAVKVSGEEYRIVFHDPRLARALGNVGADRMGVFMRILSMAGHVFRITRTTLAPVFILINPMRDFAAAQINIQGFGAEDRNAIAIAMARDWRKAFVGAYRGMNNKQDSEWTKHYLEFEKSGAKVSFWKIENAVVAKDDLAFRIRLASGPRAARIARTLVSPSAFFSSRDNGVLHWIEHVNLAIDNAIRLAAFVEARKRGWSPDKAASLAKNLTVNFNRRGELGPILNALYPFFNSAIQGGQILLRAMKSRRVAAITASLVVAGFLNGMANSYLSDTDKDGVLAYDKIPDYQSQSSLQFMIGKDSSSAVAVPMPYGYNVFPYLGQQLEKVMRGVKTPEEAMGDVAFATMNAFSPITGGDGYAFLMPTLGDPLLEMARNQDWRGVPIKPAYQDDKRPQSQQFYPGASEASKIIAENLNKWSGGTRGLSGAIDISPEYMDHMFAFVTGSAGTFWGQSADLAAKAFSGKLADVTVNDVPIARNFVHTTGDWLDKNRYFNFREQVGKAVYAVKDAAKTGETIPDVVRRWASLAPALKEAEKRRKAGEDIYLLFNAKVTKTIGQIVE